MQSLHRSHTESLSLHGALHASERSPTVLVVDDSPQCRDPLARLLRMHGYHTVCAADGREAARALEAHPHTKLVLLDLMMPHVDGLTFLRQIRDDERFKDMRVVVLSAMGDEHAQREAQRLGVSHFLLKASFTIPQLLDAVAGAA